MVARRTPIDKDAARQLRAELYAAIDRGEVSLQDAVKSMRKISRLSQPEFAARLGVSVKVIKEIERGIGNPTVGSLNRIGQFFGLEITFARSEKLRSGADESTAGNLVTTGIPSDSPRSAINEVLQMYEELEKIKQKVVPGDELKNALRSMAKELGAILQTANPQETPSCNLGPVITGINFDLAVIDEARLIIDSAERIQRQLLPPAALKEWLEDIAAAKKLLAHLERRPKDS